MADPIASRCIVQFRIDCTYGPSAHRRIEAQGSPQQDYGTLAPLGQTPLPPVVFWLMPDVTG